MEAEKFEDYPFNQNYDFNRYKTDFDIQFVSPVIDEIRIISGFELQTKGGFLDGSRKVHPREILFDYFEKVGIYPNISHNKRGYFYEILIKNKKTDFFLYAITNRSYAEYMAFITAINIRAKQLNFNFEKFKTLSIISTTGSLFVFSIFGVLPIRGCTHVLVKIKDFEENRIVQKIIRRGLINSIRHFWVIEIEKIDVTTFKIGIATAVGSIDKITTDFVYHTFKETS